MIKLDFSAATAIFMAFVLIPLFFIWFLEGFKKERPSLEKKFIWYCSICTYTYITTKEELISKCPRCSNYNKKMD
jgi:hypothetical protein